MARQIRKKSGTGIYHIMLRGIPLMIQRMKIIRSARLCRFAKQRNDPHDPRHLCRKNEN